MQTKPNFSDNTNQQLKKPFNQKNIQFEEEDDDDDDQDGQQLYQKNIQLSDSQEENDSEENNQNLYDQMQEQQKLEQLRKQIQIQNEQQQQEKQSNDDQNNSNQNHDNINENEDEQLMQQKTDSNQQSESEDEENDSDEDEQLRKLQDQLSNITSRVSNQNSMYQEQLQSVSQSFQQQEEQLTEKKQLVLQEQNFFKSGNKQKSTEQKKANQSITSNQNQNSQKNEKKAEVFQQSKKILNSVMEEIQQFRQNMNHTDGQQPENIQQDDNDSKNQNKIQQKQLRGDQFSFQQPQQDQVLQQQKIFQNTMNTINQQKTFFENNQNENTYSKNQQKYDVKDQNQNSTHSKSPSLKKKSNEINIQNAFKNDENYKQLQSQLEIFQQKQIDKQNANNIQYKQQYKQKDFTQYAIQNDPYKNSPQKQKYIKQILENRQDTLFDTLYNEAKLKDQKLKQLRQQFQEQMNAKEEKELTFQPKINENYAAKKFKSVQENEEMYEKNEYWLKGKQRNIEVIKALLEEKQKQEESQYSFKPDIKKIKPSEVAPQYRTKSGVNNHIKRQIQARIQRESIKEKLNGYSSTQKLQTYSSIKENPQNIIKNQTSMKSLVSSKSSSTLKKQFTVPTQPKFNQKQKLQEIPCLQYPYHPLSSRGSHNKQEERYLVPEQFISDFEEKQSKYSQDLDKLNNEYYVIQQQEDMQEMKYTNAQEYLRNQLLAMDI